MTRAPDSDLGPDATIQRALATHRQWFGEPRWAALAPGRVNLIGEHTDYNYGFVLPMAIDRACVAIASPMTSPSIGSRSATDSCFLSADTNENWHADLSRWVEGADFHRIFSSDHGPGRGPLRRDAWPSYIYGVLRLLHLRAVAETSARPAMPAINLTIASSVPLGAGLSSSAALEVAVAMIGEQILGLALPGPDRAALCRLAEHQYAGVPCGIMDQLISVLGRKDHALLMDCRDQSTRAISMPPSSEAVIVVMDSGVKHALASGEYAARKAACERASAALGVPSLREAELGMIAHPALSDEERRCVRHVVSENARTLAAADALTRGDLPTMGRLMNESHDSLRDDYRVSCAELDTLVRTSLATPGVFGARMTGGGFGGCAIALARPDAVDELTRRVRYEYGMDHRACAMFVTAAADGARTIPL